MSDSESGNGVPLMEPLSPSTTPEAGASRRPVSVKRKRDTASEEPEFNSEDGNGEEAAPVEEQTESKRAAKKKKKNKKPMDVARDEALDEELGVNHALAHMDGQLLADHIAQRVKRFEGDKLSGVEEDDLRVSATAVRDTTSWTRPRTLDLLQVFLEDFSKPRRGTGKHAKRKLSHAAEEKASPHTIVLAASGIRAADLTRALRPLGTKTAVVTKLFAKHIKLKEAVETVQRTRMGIGVGTAQRVADLIEMGALKVDKLERLVVDVSHIDSKKRGILDMRESVAPLVRLLNREEFKARYAETGDAKIELVFF